MTAIKYAKDQPAGFTNRIKEVAIVGASGQVGSRIADALLKTGRHNVTAITRGGNEDKMPNGIRVAKINYDELETITNALKGIQYFIISMPVQTAPGAETPSQIQTKLISCAAKAGVPWIMANCWGGDLTNEEANRASLVNGSYIKGIRDVEEQGVSSWQTLSNNFWYEYSLSLGPAAYGFDLKNKKATLYDDGEFKYSTTTWQQCGRVLAALLSLPELPQDENDKSVTLSKWRNDHIYAASFLVSQRDMLDSLHRVMGTTDKDWAIDYEDAKERHQRGMKMMTEQTGLQKMIGFQTALYAQGFFKDGLGNLEARHELVNKTLGLPKEDFDQATKRAVEMVQAGYHPAFNRSVTFDKV